MTRPSDLNVADYRQAQAPVLDLIINRWSPRAMSGESLTEAEQSSLFEAARWAPSCFNSQPWRFVYALPCSTHWDTFYNLLSSGNRPWVAKAGLLMVLLSRTRLEHNDQETDTNSFDAGAAWQNVALQGSSMGLVVHGMRGFDKDRARTELNVPDLFAIEVMIAVGRPGPISDLPDNRIEGEKPSPRNHASDFAMEGKFGF